MTRIAITGALGRMGTLIIQEAAKIKDMQLVAGFDVVGAGKTLPGGIIVRDAAELESALRESKADVLIDFTIAKAAVNNVCTAASLGINLVVGTTGFSAEQHSQMKKAIEGHVAAVITPNFSLGVNVFWKLVADAAAALKDYDIEIIEAHHNQKKDAPSGTALATVQAIRWLWAKRRSCMAGKASCHEEKRLECMPCVVEILWETTPCYSQDQANGWR